MLDLPQPQLGISLSMSHLAARQEVRTLIATLSLPGLVAPPVQSAVEPKLSSAL